jgi:hypothetical protein
VAGTSFRDRSGSGGSETPDEALPGLFSFPALAVIGNPDATRRKKSKKIGILFVTTHPW